VGRRAPPPTPQPPTPNPQSPNPQLKQLICLNLLIDIFNKYLFKILNNLLK